MRRFLLLLVFAGMGLALPSTSEALSFKVGAGLGYNFWFEKFSGDEAPSNYTVGLELGLKFSLVEVSLEGYYQTGDIEADFGSAIQGDLNFDNFFIDGVARFFIPEPLPLIKIYAGGGVTLHSTSTDVDIDSISGSPGVGAAINALEESGVGVGLKLLVGLEVGSDTHFFFAELGYRYMLTEPTEIDDNSVIGGLDAVDFNNLPIVIGYRLRI